LRSKSEGKKESPYINSEPKADIKL
jgi:hypothetical protein